MRKATYDSRFFVEFFYSRDENLRRKMKEEKRLREKYISTVVIHEVYKFSLACEGREVAALRVALMKKDFQVVPVDDQIAQVSAELRQKYNLSMGDSMIAATASVLNAVCISDDPILGKSKKSKPHGSKLACNNQKQPKPKTQPKTQPDRSSNLQKYPLLLTTRNRKCVTK